MVADRPAQGSSCSPPSLSSPREPGTGDPDAARARLEILATIPRLRASRNATALAGSLLDLGAVPRSAGDDAAHIAIAVTNGIDYLVTWNFRHIGERRYAIPNRRRMPQGRLRPPRSSARPVNSWRPRAMKTNADPIRSSYELRAVRDEHAARCGYDVEAIFRDIRAREEASGREYVSRPARRARGWGTPTVDMGDDATYCHYMIGVFDVLGQSRRLDEQTGLPLRDDPSRTTARARQPSRILRVSCSDSDACLGCSLRPPPDPQAVRLSTGTPTVRDAGCNGE